MKKKILQLEQKARILDEGDQHHNELMKSATEYGDRFLQSLPKQKAYEIFDGSVDSLLEEPIEETPGNIREIIHDIENRVIPPGLNPASGNHYGYIPGGGLSAGAAGDYLAAITNPYAGVYFSSPGAVNLERRLIRWMAELVGYPKGFGGNLTSGGSIANLTAVHTAREAHHIKPEGVRKAVVYLTDQTHHCVERALLVSGMGDCVRRNVPMDDRFRMDPSELQKRIDEDREDGLNPWMVVASAGTTDTGSVDPLDKIASITSTNKLWFHVDAAYGGFFLLTERGKKMMAGIEKSDSVVLDPHKGMFISYGSGALIVRDEELLAKAHGYDASYMQDTIADDFAYSPADLSPELSKHFRALRMWLPLKLHGVGAFRSALDEKWMLANFAWQKLSEMDDFEVGPEPQLSVFMFRYKPEHGDVDELNRKLHQAIKKDGRIFFSTTRYKGHFMLRLAVLSVRTHLENIDSALEIIKEKADELSG